MPDLRRLNATSDRTPSTIRWVQSVFDRVDALSRDLGTSRNTMFNILVREALDARALRARQEAAALTMHDLTLDESGRARVEARERQRAGV